MKGTFAAAVDAHMFELMRMLYANLNAEMLGLPLPYPPLPALDDDPRDDDWEVYGEDDYDS